MKLPARLLSVLVLSFLIAPIVLFQGCGDNESAPDGSTITLSPNDVSLNNAGETVVNLKVIVRYPNGTPMPYANVVISGGFAIPSTLGLYQFYWFPDGNLNADPAKIIPVDSGFMAQTNEYGVYDFSIVVFGLPFEDTIHVTSGTAAGTADLTVTTTT
ncbi:MAG: hypothetical protein A2X58_09695 [Nitrospirae bacterium GWC2_56_14]|nr:MAG: hypothetical protein A2X58_09695 [Nitrospirae bacterium GWC2_56_14]